MSTFYCFRRRERLRAVRNLFYNCYSTTVGFKFKNGSDGSSFGNLFGNFKEKVRFISGQRTSVWHIASSNYQYSVPYLMRSYFFKTTWWIWLTSAIAKARSFYLGFVIRFEYCTFSNVSCRFVCIITLFKNFLLPQIDSLWTFGYSNFQNHKSPNVLFYLKN